MTQPPHHRPLPSRIASPRQNHRPKKLATDFCNKIGTTRTSGHKSEQLLICRSNRWACHAEGRGFEPARRRQMRVQGLVHPPRQKAFHPRVQWINRNDAYPQLIIATVSQQSRIGADLGGLSDPVGLLWTTREQIRWRSRPGLSISFPVAATRNDR